MSPGVSGRTRLGALVPRTFDPIGSVVAARRLTSRRGQEHPSRAHDGHRADLYLRPRQSRRSSARHRRELRHRRHGRRGRFPRLPGRDRLTDGIEREAVRRRDRDRPSRRRRVRVEARRGCGDAARPRCLRDRGADRPDGRQVVEVRIDDARRVDVRLRRGPEVAAPRARATSRRTASGSTTQRLPGPRRRHGYEHDAHRSRDRRGARDVTRRRHEARWRRSSRARR